MDQLRSVTSLQKLVIADNNFLDGVALFDVVENFEAFRYATEAGVQFARGSALQRTEIPRYSVRGAPSRERRDRGIDSLPRVRN